MVPSRSIPVGSAVSAWRCRRWLLSLLMLPLAGCGSGNATVDGKVVWKDGSAANELQGSYVVFENPAFDVSARGLIQGDGSFQLTTEQPDDGVPPGNYKVLILEVGRKPLGGPDSSLMAPSVMDSRYQALDTTDLQVEVKSGVNPVTLELDRNKQQ